MQINPFLPENVDPLSSFRNEEVVKRAQNLAENYQKQQALARESEKIEFEMQQELNDMKEGLDDETSKYQNIQGLVEGGLSLAGSFGGFGSGAPKSSTPVVGDKSSFGHSAPGFGTAQNVDNLFLK